MSADEVLVIGAGPFGLSISAHLRELGVSHRIVGRPLDTWRAHMPAGMNLKSEPYASDFSAPRPGYDVGAFCASRGIDYAKRLGPLPVERFLAYGDWYVEQLVPAVCDFTVTGIAATGSGYRATFAEAEPETYKSVVVATGVVPHAHIPSELSDMPADLVSHTADHHLLDGFRGRRVAVVGAGQSALETAALLHEAGADTQLVVRGPAVHFITPNPEKLSRLGQIRRPATKLCEGWHCKFWNTPAAFRLLPEEMRIEKARTVLGPNGSWWLKERIDGVVDVLTAHSVKGAVAAGSGVQLLLDGPKRSTLEADHVIAGTGFRVDLGRLRFLPQDVRAAVETRNGFPVLNRNCESTVPGLYFVGAPAAVSLGPSMRFIGGTHNVAGRIARSLARRGKVSDRSYAAHEPQEATAAEF